MKEKNKATALIKSIWHKYNFILIFLAILAVFLIINSGATTMTTFMNIPRHSTVIGIIALGMGLIILTGDIDLSVGSQLALVGGLTVMVFNNTNSIAVSLLFSVFMGVVLGLINGVLIGLVKMPAFIVTLATIIVVVAVMTYLSTSTKFGKRVYALGSNERAAQLSGINVSMTRVLVFVIAGVLMGIASFLYVANVGSVDPATSGKNYELYSIAGVVIGGISMSGGRGRILGVVFGSMSFTIIDKIITALGLNPLINDTIKGAILLLAIAVQMLPVITQKLRKARTA